MKKKIHVSAVGKVEPDNSSGDSRKVSGDRPAFVEGADYYHKRGAALYTQGFFSRPTLSAVDRTKSSLSHHQELRPWYL